MQMDDPETKQLMLALGVVVLSVIGILAFAFGASAIIFYGAVIVAIILGFYLTYNISRGPTTDLPKPRKPVK